MNYVLGYIEYGSRQHGHFMIKEENVICFIGPNEKLISIPSKYKYNTEFWVVWANSDEWTKIMDHPMNSYDLLNKLWI